MRFSEQFNLQAHNQRNLDFVNIRLDIDNRLFIDPTRIAAENGPFFQRSTVIIQDFFNTIFDLYSEGKTEEAREFFGSSRESNEIFLGYTDGFPGGKGNSEKSLTEVFDFIHGKGLLEDGIVGRLEDFYIFVPSFGEDLLSDLVASLIKSELIVFTQEQCKKHEILTSIEITRPYWDHLNHRWEETTEMLPEVNGHPIVLIPKEILVTKYLYSSERYWQQVVSLWRQQKNKEGNSFIHQQRPKHSKFASKKEIRRVEVKEQNITDKPYLVNMTRENPVMIKMFRYNINNTQRGSNSNKMKDDELESFIKNSY